MVSTRVKQELGEAEWSPGGDVLQEGDDSGEAADCSGPLHAGGAGGSREGGAGATEDVDHVTRDVATPG